MRKFLILTVLVGAAVFAAVSLANDGSGSRAANVSAKSSRALRYLFADVNLTPNETAGRAFKCPKKWHPVSGLFEPDSDEVVTAFDGPISARKWRVRVRNEGHTQASVTIGAVCEKGLPITGTG
jgi:hypothetical protein